MTRWRYDAGGRTAMTLKAHKDWVTQCCFSRDGNRILSVSRDRTAKLWDSHIGIKLCKYSSHTDWLTAGSVSFDNCFFVSSSGDTSLKLWNIQSDSNYPKICTFRGHTDWVSSCEFSPVDFKIVSGSRDKTLRIWDSETKTQTLCLQGHQWEVSSTIYSPDGSIVASGSWDRLVKLWDSRGGRNPIIQSLDGHIDWITGLSFSGDGKYLASCSSDRKVNIWDLRTNTVLTRFSGHTNTVNDVTFFPEDHFIASCSDDRTVKVWDAFTGTEILSLTGHTAPVTGVHWCPADKRYILSSSQDRTVKLWHVEIDKQKVTTRTPVSRIRSKLSRADSLHNAVVCDYDPVISKSEDNEQRNNTTLRSSDSKMMKRGRPSEQTEKVRAGTLKVQGKVMPSLADEPELKRSISNNFPDPSQIIIDAEKWKNSPSAIKKKPKGVTFKRRGSSTVDALVDLPLSESYKKKPIVPSIVVPVLNIPETPIEEKPVFTLSPRKRSSKF